MDDFFHCDFLLTYRSFLSSAQPIVDKIKDVWEEAQPRQRERVGVVGWAWSTACDVHVCVHSCMYSVCISHVMLPMVACTVVWCMVEGSLYGSTYIVVDNNDCP